MAWYADIPESRRWTFYGIIPLIGILGVYYSNTKWMYLMCRKRKPKVPPATAAVNGAKPNGVAPVNGIANGNGHVKAA
jgi:hypothetical protein